MPSSRSCARPLKFAMKVRPLRNSLWPSWAPQGPRRAAAATPSPADPCPSAPTYLKIVFSRSISQRSGRFFPYLRHPRNLRFKSGAFRTAFGCPIAGIGRGRRTPATNEPHVSALIRTVILENRVLLAPSPSNTPSSHSSARSAKFAMKVRSPRKSLRPSWAPQGPRRARPP